ncbi:MAG TPA: hypothetical protein VHZ50_06600, partial [Puia sp.]|nr:hypothetical protein [Puia sp.]
MFNSNYHESIKISPFKANYGFKPEIYYDPKENKNPAVQGKELTEKIKDIQDELSKDLKFIKFKTAQYYNRGREQEPSLQEGGVVFLNVRNMKTQRPSRKLDNIRKGPFKIKRKLSNLIYELELPAGMKVHPIFHVSLLEPAYGEASVQEQIDFEDQNDETIYEVEKLLKQRKQNGQWQYLVKWKNYGNEENTWEPENHINPYLIKKFK